MTENELKADSVLITFPKEIRALHNMVYMAADKESGLFG